MNKDEKEALGRFVKELNLPVADEDLNDLELEVVLFDLALPAYADRGALDETTIALQARVAELEAFAKEAAEELEAAAQEAEDLAAEISAASESQPEDCFVRFKHTSVNGQQRIPVGAVVLNPTLQLLQATHGRWDWVTRETWAATPQRFVVARGLVWPWRA